MGTLLDDVAAVHPHRPLVSEADGDLVLTTTEAAAVVDRWAGAVAARSAPGDRVVLATPNGYAQFLATLAVCRAGRLPAPVNAQMTAGRGAPRGGRLRRDVGGERHRRRARRWRAARRAVPAEVPTWRRSSTRRAPRASAEGRPAHPQRAARRHGDHGAHPHRAAARRGGARLALRPHLRVLLAVGAACAGIASHVFRRFHPSTCSTPSRSGGPRLRRGPRHLPDARGGGCR
jgi:hypothetical protein